jgi:hypothetical protein
MMDKMIMVNNMVLICLPCKINGDDAGERGHWEQSGHGGLRPAPGGAWTRPRRAYLVA